MWRNVCALLFVLCCCSVSSAQWRDPYQNSGGMAQQYRYTDRSGTYQGMATVQPYRTVWTDRYGRKVGSAVTNPPYPGTEHNRYQPYRSKGR
jgi:hypothetical protein